MHLRQDELIVDAAWEPIADVGLSKLQRTAARFQIPFPLRSFLLWCSVCSFRPVSPELRTLCLVDLKARVLARASLWPRSGYLGRIALSATPSLGKSLKKELSAGRMNSAPHQQKMLSRLRN